MSGDDGHRSAPADDADRQFEFFDRFTPSYDDSRVDFMIDELTRLGPGARVVDLGCGDGSVLRHLTERVADLDAVGLDPSPRYVERGRAAGLDVRTGSILDPDLGQQIGDGYDAVLVVAVLHHLVGGSRRRSRAYVRQALANAASILRPGGRLLIYEPTYRPRLAMDAVFLAKSLVMRLAGNRRVELGRRWLNIGAPLVSYYNTDELAEMLAELGLVLEATEIVSTGSIARVARRQSVGLIVARP